MNAVIGKMMHELREHAPFTLLGSLVGVVFMAVMVRTGVSASVSQTLFEISHPAHVLLSAVATAAMYRLHSRASLWATFAVGYTGAIGVASVSDCIIPYFGEWLLGLPNRHMHLGFIEEWYLVNPLAVLGIMLACVWPHTKVPHSGHVFLSMWASLFHMFMALGDDVGILTMVLVPVFIFLAVWLPCCTSDILFPLLFARAGAPPPEGDRCHAHAKAEVSNREP